MTEKEAIKMIECANAEVEWSCPLNYTIAFDMAIKALERQIPKKLIKEKSLKYDREFYKYENTKTKCPCCGRIFLSNNYKHCSNCGQKLDWSEEE